MRMRVEIGELKRDTVRQFGFTVLLFIAGSLLWLVEGEFR